MYNQIRYLIELGKTNPQELAAELVKINPDFADDLSSAIGFQLQDKEVGTWSEFAEEGLKDV